MTAEPFAGVVLTGGASTRMGTDKAFIEVDGQPLVLRVVEALRTAGADPIAAIGGDLDRLRALGVDAYPDREAGQGPLGGIVTALEVIDADLVFVAACDLIALGDEAILEVLEAMTPDADAVVPRSDRLEPLLAAYRRRCLPHLRDELARGERAPHRAIEGLAVVQVRLHDANALEGRRQPGRPADSLISCPPKSTSMSSLACVTRVRSRSSTCDAPTSTRSSTCPARCSSH